MDAISHKKETSYQEAFRPYLRLIDGLPDLLKKADEKGIKMAIGSAAIPFNIDFVLDNLGIRHYFPVVVSANDVAISKPHPETFIKAAAGLECVSRGLCCLRGCAKRGGSGPQCGNEMCGTDDDA